VDLGLTGRVALVTGSARGIGAAILRELAGAGVKIIVSDVDGEATNAAASDFAAQGIDVFAQRCDVCDRTQVASLCERIAERFGGVDILVNNAGFTRDRYLTKMEESDWDAVVDTALKGAFHCTRAVLPHMMRQHWGRIVNISSRSIFGNPGQTSYSTAKAGLIGFTRSLALEQARFGITVNAVAPGFVETELMKSLPTYEKLRQTALERIPVGFLGEPTDIAAAVAFLASERARYITGTTLFVTGGRYAS
jgi:3-oxoacyl-[acyl-carrier protein] reductase